MKETISRFLIKTLGCDELKIFTSDDTLFEFSTSLYYSPQLDQNLSEALDLFLLSLKLNQKNERAQEKLLGSTKSSRDNEQITFEKILAPLLAVLIAVLLTLGKHWPTLFNKPFVVARARH